MRSKSFIEQNTNTKENDSFCSIPVFLFEDFRFLQLYSTIVYFLLNNCFHLFELLVVKFSFWIRSIIWLYSKISILFEASLSALHLIALMKPNKFSNINSEQRERVLFEVVLCNIVNTNLMPTFGTTKQHPRKPRIHNLCEFFTCDLSAYKFQSPKRNDFCNL